MTTFDELGVTPKVAEALVRLGITKPTPIQAQAVPLALAGHDILGLAQTGTGKTLAFALPLVQALLEAPGKPQPKTAKTLILAPTRELVNQIAESVRGLTADMRLRTTVVVGGQSIGRQVGTLARGTDILVATPGRLIDLIERKAVDLGQVRHLVLDEADQMLDMGFIHALRQIAPLLGTPRQTMLLSATMPKEMEALSRAYLDQPKRIEVAPPGKAVDKIAQRVRFVEKADKPEALREVLAADRGAMTLVFARTKHGAERLMKGLVKDGFDAASIHGNKSQGQRERALKAFREGDVNVLVATDVAARGIDIPGVAMVVNFDLPQVPENYVHRIGRTARAGREGEAIAFCAADEVELLLAIEKLMRIEIPAEGGQRPSWSKPRQAQAPKGGARRRKGRDAAPAKSEAPAKRRRPRRRRKAAKAA